MHRPAYALRQVFGTARGAALFAGNFLAAFGVVSAVVQFVAQMFPVSVSRPGLTTLTSLGACITWGLARAWPRRHIQRVFRHPDITVTILTGDLFAEQAHLVVGFTDTFDTSVAGDWVISQSSIQGQFVMRRYGGDHRRLDRELSSALAGCSPVRVESRQDKPKGKLTRYPIGTVAVLGDNRQLVFGVAYSRMGNDLVARSSVDDIWLSLSRLWDAVFQHAHREPVAIALVGSGLARIDFLDRESMLKVILLSFVARSRASAVSRELRVVIRPADVEKLNMLEVAAFLRTL
jgi:hypothetical protein